MEQEHFKFFKPTNWAINNRTSVYIITVLITLAGIIIFQKIPKENFPDIVIPTIYVPTIYPGASPEDIENLITKPLEKEIKGISGIKKLTSNSIQDVSVILVEFNTGIDVDVAKQKVSNAVDKAKTELPSDLDKDPNVQEVSFSEFPIMNVNVAGDYPLDQLKKYAEELQDKIETLPEITRVDLIGGLEREVQINVDLYRMQALGITFNDIERSVASENVNISGGEIRVGELRRTMRVRGEFGKVEQIGNVLIRSSRGNLAYLKDFTEVIDGFKEKQDFARLDGKPVITMNVIKRSGENLINAADQIKEIINEYQNTRFPSGLKVNVTADTSLETKTTLNDLINTVIIGFILVVLILMFFMGLQSAFFVGLSVPLSVLLAMLFMPSMGFTMNMIVLFSFLLALGIIVDDAIVVIENTHRIYHKYNFDIITSAKAAAGEVFIPVLAGTLTTIAPFFPLLFWPGIVGDFMKYLPITLILTLFASLAVAFIMNTVFAVSFMKKEEPGKVVPASSMKKPLLIFGITGLLAHLAGFHAFGNLALLLLVLTPVNHYLLRPATETFQHKWWPAVISLYKRTVTALLKGARPVWTLTIVFVGLIVSVLIFASVGKPPVFFPDGQPNFAYVYIEMPIGTDAVVTDSVTKVVENKVYEVIGRNNPNVTSVISNVAIGAGDPRSPDRTATPYKGKVSVAFVEFGERKDFSSAECLEDIRKSMKNLVPGARITVDKEQNGPPTGKPVNIEISGDDFDQLQRLEKELRKGITQSKIEGIEDLQSDLKRNKPEIIITIDADRASALGMSKAQIALEIRTALYGKEISKFRDADDDAEINLRLSPEYRMKVDDLMNMQVSFMDMATGQFKSVPISSVASVKYDEAFSSINRKNQRRVLTLSSNVLTGFTPNAIVQQINQVIDGIEIPEGYTIKMTGEQEDQKETADFLGLAFLGALALMFLILVTQFNSLAKPFLIFSTVLFSLIGVFLGHAITGRTMSIVMTGVGIFALAGIVIRNGILLIEFIDELRSRGLSSEEAIIEGGATRMTPVILTASAAILGLIPLALGVNLDFASLFGSFEPHFYLGGDNVVFWGPLAWTMIYGLVVASFLTLLVVPVMYLIYLKIKKRFGREKSDLHEVHSSVY
ncbi:MAG: efflux RND transporter permease subunit [Bacteroidia bacterium]|nr:efflux RND transporter permease subunit [Bacteroidia bacterium]